MTLLDTILARLRRYGRLEDVEARSESRAGGRSQDGLRRDENQGGGEADIQKFRNVLIKLLSQVLHAQVARYKQVFQGTVDAVKRFSCNTRTLILIHS